jgi:uracil-DNA glycosylase
MAAVRVTLNDGRVAVGAEGELLDRMFRTDEGLTTNDVTQIDPLPKADTGIPGLAQDPTVEPAGDDHREDRRHQRLRHRDRA